MGASPTVLERDFKFAERSQFSVLKSKRQLQKGPFGEHVKGFGGSDDRARRLTQQRGATFDLRADPE